MMEEHLIHAMVSMRAESVKTKSSPCKRVLRVSRQCHQVQVACQFRTGFRGKGLRSPFRALADAGGCVAGFASGIPAWPRDSMLTEQVVPDLDGGVAA